MPPGPVANDGCEFAHLKIQARVVPWRIAQRIFVGASFGGLRGRVKTAINARLRKNVNMWAELGVEKQSEAWIKKIMAFRVDQAGRRLLEMIIFEIDRAAQARAGLVVQKGPRQFFFDAIEKILCGGAGGRESKQTQCQRAGR